MHKSVCVPACIYVYLRLVLGMNSGAQSCISRYTHICSYMFKRQSNFFTRLTVPMIDKFDLWSLRICCKFCGFEKPTFWRLVFMYCVTITCSLERVTTYFFIVEHRSFTFYWSPVWCWYPLETISISVQKLFSSSYIIPSLFCLPITEVFHKYWFLLWVAMYHTIASYLFVLGVILQRYFIIKCPSYIMIHQQIIQWWQCLWIANDVGDIFGVISTNLHR